MCRQIEKAFVELDLSAHGMVQDSGFLVVNQHLFGNATEVAEAADEPLVGVLSVKAVGGPGVKAARVAELIDDEVDLGRLAGQGGTDLAPVTLQLHSRVGFEAHGGAARTQGALGCDVGAQDGDAAVIALGFNLAENDDCIPDALGQQPIDRWLERVQLARARLGSGDRRPTTFEGTRDGLGMDAEFGGDIGQIDAALGQGLNDHEVLLSKHEMPPCPNRTGDILAGEQGTF